MCRRIDLPDGGWADIKDPSELTELDRRTIRKAGVPLFAVRAQIREAGLQKPAEELTDAENERVLEITFASDAVSDQNAAFVAVYTTGWSYDKAVTVESVLSLPGPVFDLLVSATTGRGDGSVDTSVDGAADPASPTVPSPV